MSQPSNATDLERMSISEALEKLSSDAEAGLSHSEANRRLEKHGENVIEEKARNPILRLLSNFWGPIPWMIEIAAILAAAVQRWEDFGVISTMLLINAGVSFWHENKATNAIEALKENLAPQALVVRDGEQQTIAARQLVPGDIIIIRMGDIVPADSKLLADQHLSVDESSLTGESLPVDKDEGALVYSGTTIGQGEVKAAVTATGRNTKFARTVELVETAQESSHFRRAVLRIGYFLIGTAGVLVATIVAASLFRGDNWVDVILFAMVLTIASIPVALPAVLSVTMSVGASRLAKWKAIVSRLASIEEMAGLEVLCADKTGTLTKNKLELQHPVAIEAEDEHDLVVAAALASRRNVDDPIDKAVLGALEDLGSLDGYQVVDFRPFDPTRKRAEADVEHDGAKFSVAKGAPQVILDLVDAEEDQRRDISDKVDKLGEEGFRALGVARTGDDGRWRYLGILPLLDPPRDDSAEVIRAAQDHGIDIRMVTGDHEAIGRQVAGQLGLGQNIKKAAELFGESKEEKEHKGEEHQVSEETLSADGFSEVTPEHKFNIIKWFQTSDRIVGMTGDGVNDAPALKQADVGIAVAGATDAARSAADLVLTEPGLGVITRAVEEARRIFERMTSYATFRITETIRVLLFLSVAILAFDYYPVTPIMIVLLAIMNDIPIMTIAWDNAPTAEHPVRWDMPRVLTIASVLGLAGVASSFLLFWYVEHQMDISRDTIQTMIFLKLLVAGHMTIFLTRNKGPLWQKPWPSLSLFLALEGTQVIGTLVAVYGWLVHPIGWGYALAIWGYALVWLLMLSGVKMLTIQASNRLQSKAVQYEEQALRA